MLKADGDGKEKPYTLSKGDPWPMDDGLYATWFATEKDGVLGLGKRYYTILFSRRKP